MSGIWVDDGRGWQALPPVGFPLEKNLHDCIEQAPAMLPLPGRPRLAVLGREVRCGSGLADLVAVDAVTGQPVVIEIKLASNTDRRTVLTQVLGYAAFLHRLTPEDFESLLAPHLAKAGHTSVRDAVAGTVQEASIDADTFSEGLAEALAAGRFRCVVVIDSAPADLVDLVGYLQLATNDLLTIDLVTVTSYDVGGRQVLVPQLVEPDRRATLPPASSAAKAAGSYITRGGDVFAASIEDAEPEQQDELRRLYRWAQGLESDGLTVLYSSTGKGRWVLNLRLPGQERALLSIWNDHGPFVSPWRSVLQAEAPSTLDRIEAALPGEIGQGRYLRSPITDAVLELFRDAYREARK